MKYITFTDIPRLAGPAQFRPSELYYPEMESNRQQEWEYYVTKLHGADLAATDEDLETIKNLVNKLGR